MNTILRRNYKNADYADDLVLPAKTPAQERSLLYSEEQVTAGILLYVNEIKQRTCVIKKVISISYDACKRKTRGIQDIDIKHIYSGNRNKIQVN